MKPLCLGCVLMFCQRVNGRLQFLLEDFKNLECENCPYLRQAVMETITEMLKKGELFSVLEGGEDEPNGS